MADADERYTSHRQLTVDDFEQLARDRGLPVQSARKKGLVAARPATADTPVATQWNGEETRNVARTGDMIVTSLDAAGAPLVDGAGNKNVYVIKKPRFAELYEALGQDGPDGPIHCAVGSVRCIELKQGFAIVAPWGERQTADSGYLVANGGDVYGNNAETFEKTYEIV